MPPYHDVGLPGRLWGCCVKWGLGVVTLATTALRAILATLAATPWLALPLTSLATIVLADLVRVYRQSRDDAGGEGVEGNCGGHFDFSQTSETRDHA